MKTFFFKLLFALCLLQGPAMCSPVASTYNQVNQDRSANTCADPTLAEIYVVGYNPSLTWHDFSARTNFINDATRNGVDWRLQGPAFIAWTTAQEFTVPFYELVSTDPDDLIFLPANNGTPPAVSGYSVSGIIAYVYDTQVCGSVSLLVAFEETVGDHYYTTSATEHSALINEGWVDEGTAAFVLPIPTDGAWSF